MVNLCEDIIKLTASFNTGVGDKPIQIAVIRKNGQSTITEDIFPKHPSLMAAGLSGCVYTSDYPFGGPASGGNMVNCVVENNQFPVAIDGNFIYGGIYTNVTFSYSGGKVFFGKNNKLVSCKIILKNRSSFENLKPILKHYGSELIISQ